MASIIRRALSYLDESVEDNLSSKHRHHDGGEDEPKDDPHGGLDGVEDNIQDGGPYGRG